MSVSRTRALAAGLATLALTACMVSPPVIQNAGAAPILGPDLGPSTRAGTPNLRRVHGGHADAHATGVINALDMAKRTINLSHQPIKALGWPAMTMDFPVSMSVDLKTLQPGMHVDVTLGKGADGMYQIEAVTPAAPNGR